ncbi:hypothetical protein LJR230_004239 [Trinickia sp. LjRoot230]|uniref:hypothetical protein n=1 Tax=Trinickia sp. LjRoot230 TaxID=3342288 RepID=UPI003ECEA0C5
MNLRIAFERPSNGRLPRFINVPLAGIPPDRIVDIVMRVVSQFIELYRDEIDKGIMFSLLPPALEAAISASDLDFAHAMRTMMTHHGFGRVICRFEQLGWLDKRLIFERQVLANEPPRPMLPASVTTDAGNFRLKTADLIFPTPALDRSSPVEPPSRRYVPEGYFYVEVEGTADGAFLHPEGRRMDAHETIYLLLTSVDELGPGDAVAWRIRNMPDQLAAACAKDLADIMGGPVFVPASSAVADAGEFVSPNPEKRRSNGAPVVACRRGEDLFGQPVLEFDEKIVFTIDAIPQTRDRSAFPFGNEATLDEIDRAEE